MYNISTSTFIAKKNDKLRKQVLISDQRANFGYLSLVRQGCRAAGNVNRR